ncbi:hypothetical protein FHU30_003147 [Actinomadura rupiterrae]|nr:hypothetical protein [Actinomadura rupiterrae]
MPPHAEQHVPPASASPRHRGPKALPTTCAHQARHHAPTRAKRAPPPPRARATSRHAQRPPNAVHVRWPSAIHCDRPWTAQGSPSKLSTERYSVSMPSAAGRCWPHARREEGQIPMSRIGTRVIRGVRSRVRKAWSRCGRRWTSDRRPFGRHTPTIRHIAPSVRSDKAGEASPALIRSRGHGRPRRPGPSEPNPHRARGGHRRARDRRWSRCSGPDRPDTPAPRRPGPPPAHPDPRVEQRPETPQTQALPDKGHRGGRPTRPLPNPPPPDITNSQDDHDNPIQAVPNQETQAHHHQTNPETHHQAQTHPTNNHPHLQLPNHP